MSEKRLQFSVHLLKIGVAQSIFALGEQRSTYLPGATVFNDLGCDVRAEFLISQGISNSNIIRIPRGIDTIGEAFAVRNYCLKNSLTNLAIVTSANHIARTHWLFDRLFLGKAKFLLYPLSDGDIVDLEEEVEYLKLYQDYFVTKFNNNWIEEPSIFDDWYKDNNVLYIEAAKIREKFKLSGRGTKQAYISAPGEK